MSMRRGLAWAGVAFLLALLLLVPLQLLLPRIGLPPGLGAVEAGGSLWNGRLRAAHWRGQAVGDLRIGLAPLPLLAGRQQLHLRNDSARVVLSRGRLAGLGDGDGVVPLPPFAGVGLRALLEDARLLFDAGGCREAGGRVRVELTLPLDTLPPMILAGIPACEGDGGRLVLVPEDASAPLGLEATLDIEADGRYRLQALARGDNPAFRAALQAAGFQAAAGGMSRVSEGHLN
ncbi:type II secretion system protein N [Luteimonas sp. MC1782]|uniref:type II secretion system protein N n=1 Tax=Luteimonas sp. MC1782 TaxID=2760305 RepID=UPI0015FECA92|nr:type II secretion system protein N [Luteimonas sp. MC1782]MBB1472435.1 type II secretion system protein N [Luteimonas sp. MC1782]